MACFKLYEIYSDERYITICRDYAEFLMNEASREKNGMLFCSDQIFTIPKKSRMEEIRISTMKIGAIYLIITVASAI